VEVGEVAHADDRGPEARQDRRPAGQQPRMMLGLSALADADPQELKATLTPIFRALLAEPARYSAA
jgi:hypothetical protein